MKKIILLILIFLTFGCSAKYELTIEENKISETLTLYGEEMDTDKESLYAKFREEYPKYYDEEFMYYAPTEKLDNVDYYEKSITETYYSYNAIYKANFSLDDYKRSRILNNTFANYNIGYNKEENYYYIIAQNLKIYNYNNTLSNIEIRINLNDYVVVESNSAYREMNTLIWNFPKKENNETDRIIVKYRKKQEINNNPIIDNNQNPNNNEVKKDNNFLLIVALFLGFFIILYIVLYLKNRYSKTNN